MKINLTVELSCRPCPLPEYVRSGCVSQLEGWRLSVTGGGDQDNQRAEDTLTEDCEEETGKELWIIWRLQKINFVQRRKKEPVSIKKCCASLLCCSVLWLNHVISIKPNALKAANVCEVK